MDSIDGIDGIDVPASRAPMSGDALVDAAADAAAEGVAVAGTDDDAAGTTATLGLPSTAWPVALMMSS
jgi:hypothetical protein